MKIRNGFVSNSSSSSFIIKFSNKFPDTASIAENMIKNKYEDFRDFGYDDWENILEKSLKNCKTLKDGDDPYIPIYFTSTNYNTYIIPLTNNYVLIDTCNNVTWDIQYSDGVVNKIPEEVMKKYPESEDYNGSEIYIRSKNLNEFGDNENIIYNENFYLIEHGIEMSTPSGYKTCDKCYNDIWLFNGKEYCVNCDHNTLMRGIKIKKLKNAII